jgi:ABC-type multidrug transport system fused ATPase/permease subunit
MTTTLDRWFESFAVGRQFLADLVPHRWRLAFVVVLSFLLSAVELLRPWPIQWVFDGALVRVDERYAPATFLWTGVAAAALLALGHALLHYRRQLALADVGHRVTRGLRHRLFAHLSRLSPSFHARHKSGDLLVRLMGDAPMVRTMLVDSSVELVTRSVLVLGTLAVLFSLDPLLTGVLLATLPVLLVAVRALSRRLAVAVGKQRRKEGALADFLHEAIAGTNVIQSLGREDHVVRRFARSNRRDARAGLKATRLAARLSATVESSLGVALACALGLGGWRVLSGHLTPGELLVFLSYVRGLLKPIRAASRHAGKVAKGTACGRRLLDVLERRIDVTSEASAPPAPALPRRLTFEDVSYSYDGERPALSGFDAEFRLGERVALVGRSGAGKSTAAALAIRLFDPQSGTVSLDGTPVRLFELESLRERFALCLQETTLFGETIRENLLLGRPDATDEELLAACAEVGADRFLEGLDEGLDTRLGTAGVGLSGGQRRLLSLARALLRNAPILIVDEPFVGLDRAGVERVDRCLKRAAERGLVIAIAHDLDDLDSFDRILLVEDGRVVATGTHGELSRGSALYRSVVRAAPGATP